jgi:tetratricopeptide (TPR) repeat protein
MYSYEKQSMSNLSKYLIYYLVSVTAITTFAHQDGYNTQLKFGAAYQKAYKYVFQLQLDQARAIGKNEFSNPDFVLIEQYCNVIEALVVNSGSAIDKVKKSKKTLLKKIKSLPITETDKALLESEILLTTATVRLKNGEYLTAFQEIRSAYKLYEIHLQQIEYPWRDHLLFRYAILQTLIGTVPDQFSWGIRLIGLEGDMDQGMKTLQLLLDKNKSTFWAQPELIGTLTFFQLHLFSHFDQAKQLATDSRLTKLESPLGLFVEAVVNRRMGLNNQVLEKLVTYEPKTLAIEFSYLYYMKGEALTRKLDPQSIAVLKNYIQQYQGPHFKRASWQMIGWMEWILNNDSEAYTYAMQEIQKAPESIIERDKSATREADLAKLPNQQLLRARLFYDGGYYIQAKGSLDQIQIRKHLKLDEIIELDYRYGRIYQSLNQTFKAHDYFNQVLHYKSDSKSYMICQSAIQKAEMYEESGQYANALKYFELALSLKPDEYKNGLHQKAKAGKLRVKKKQK